MTPYSERNLLLLMHDVSRLSRVEADKRARVHGMTRAQWGLISRLDRHPGLSQKELADQLDVEPISVARMVDRLEANGLLERRADANDRRIWRLHLLPAAAPMLTEMSKLAEEFGVFITQNIPPAVLDAMRQGLMQMKLNLLQKSETPAPQPEPAATEPAASGPIREIA